VRHGGASPFERLAHLGLDLRGQGSPRSRLQQHEGVGTRFFRCLARRAARRFVRELAHMVAQRRPARKAILAGDGGLRVVERERAVANGVVGLVRVGGHGGTNAGEGFGITLAVIGLAVIGLAIMALAIAAFAAAHGGEQIFCLRLEMFEVGPRGKLGVHATSCCWPAIRNQAARSSTSIAR
jgi:hypothetical protein